MRDAEVRRAGDCAWQIARPHDRSPGAAPPQVLGLNRTIYALKRVRFQNKDQEVRLGSTARLAHGAHPPHSAPSGCGMLRQPRALSCRDRSGSILPIVPAAPVRAAQQAVKGFIDEISLLRQLRGKSNIIQLIDAQASACCWVPPADTLAPSLLALGCLPGIAPLQRECYSQVAPACTRVHLRERGFAALAQRNLSAMVQSAPRAPVPVSCHMPDCTSQGE